MANQEAHIETAPKHTPSHTRRALIMAALVVVLSVVSVTAWFTYDRLICQPINVMDAQFEAFIRDTVDKPIGELKTCHVEHIENLVIRKQDRVSSLAGLEAFTNLKQLTVWEADIEDLSPLARLYEMERLTIRSTYISDLSPLESLTKLEFLSLTASEVESLEPLMGLNNMESLSLDANQISDLAPLAQLNNLRTLSLTDNQITDLSPLMNLDELLRLFVSGNLQLSDLTPLPALSGLMVLNIGDTAVTDLRPLTRMENLQVVFAANNQLTDVSPLLDVDRLWSVNLNNNPFGREDDACKLHIKELRSRREVLSVRANTCSSFGSVIDPDDSPDDDQQMQGTRIRL